MLFTSPLEWIRMDFRIKGKSCHFLSSLLWRTEIKQHSAGSFPRACHDALCVTPTHRQNRSQCGERLHARLSVCDVFPNTRGCTRSSSACPGSGEISLMYCGFNMQISCGPLIWSHWFSGLSNYGLSTGPPRDLCPLLARLLWFASASPMSNAIRMLGISTEVWA